MGKYDVNFSCGHCETVQLFGKMAERRSRIAYWESNGICSACYAQRVAEERAEAHREAAEAAKAAGLPELTGSAKQIAWAETIRAKCFEAANKAVANGEVNLGPMRAVIERLKGQTSAAWWIENRRKSSEWLFSEIAVEIYGAEEET